MNIDALPAYGAVLPDICWQIVWAISQRGRDGSLLISKSAMAEAIHLKTEKELRAVLEETRRRGVIAYRYENEALLIRLALGDRGVEQFEETMDALRSARSKV